MNNDKKFQKKALKLVDAIKKCKTEDLVLFTALIMIRFDYLLFDKGIHAFKDSQDLKRTLDKDNGLHELLWLKK